MTDKYEPLDPAELAAAGVHPERLVWTPIVPIPDGEKPPWSLIRRLCPRGHKLLTAWPYRTPSGGVSSIVARYNKTGKNGLFDKLKKALAERMLNAEMDHHLTQEVAEPARNCANHRNGNSKKTVLTDAARSSGRAICQLCLTARRT